MGTLAVTLAANKHSATDATTSYTVTSVPLVSGTEYVAFVHQSVTSGTPPSVTSIASTSLTMAHRTPTSGNETSGIKRMEVWYGVATASATETVTVSFTGTVNAQDIDIFKVVGTDTGSSGANAIVQEVITASSTATSTSTTLSAFASSNNRPLAACVHLANEATAHDSANSYTELADAPHASPASAWCSQWKSSASHTTPGFSWTTSSQNIPWAVELKQGNEALAGVTTGTFGQSAPLKGTGNLAALATVTFAQAPLLKGTGRLLAVAALTFAQSAPLTARAALAGTMAAVFGAAAAILALGRRNGVAALTFGHAAALTTSGSSGVAALVFGRAAALTGIASLTGASALVFGRSAPLTGRSALAASASTVFGKGATALTGHGALAGISALVFTTAAFFPHEAAIEGVAALVFGTEAFAFAHVPATITRPSLAPKPQNYSTYNAQRARVAIAPQPRPSFAAYRMDRAQGLMQPPPSRYLHVRGT